MKDIKTQWPWLPYVAPMVLFLVLTSLESSLPGAGESTVSPWYPLFYAFKIILVIACLVFFRSTWADLRPMPKAAGTAVAIALGLLVIVVWVGLDGH
jgi:hypothetical protein